MKTRIYAAPAVKGLNIEQNIIISNTMKSYTQQAAARCDDQMLFATLG